MGPDNRNMEPVRDESFANFDDQPDLIMHHVETNGEQMEVDDSEDLNDGYLRLQTFDNGEEMPANDSDSSDSDEEEDEENEYDFSADANIPEEPYSAVPPIVSSEAEIQAEIWNSPRPQDTIELNTEKTQQILKAMSKFSLPNVPAWANEVNSSELVQRIKSKEPTTSEKKWNSKCTINHLIMNLLLVLFLLFNILIPTFLQEKEEKL